MIFVTVGTHEQQFNRLVEYIDKLKESGEITDEVIIQTGYSTYEPKRCTWSKFYPYDEMLKLVEQADIVITHGGPSSFIMPLQIGKTPIVVPRQTRFDEHVNDHQMEFCRAVKDRFGNIIVVEDIEDLSKSLDEYAEIIINIKSDLSSNNNQFCIELENQIEKLL